MFIIRARTLARILFWGLLFLCTFEQITSKRSLSPNQEDSQLNKYDVNRSRRVPRQTSLKEKEDSDVSPKSDTDHLAMLKQIISNSEGNKKTETAVAVNNNGASAMAPMFQSFTNDPLTQKEGFDKATDMANTILKRLGLTMDEGIDVRRKEENPLPSTLYQTDELNALVNEANANRIDLQGFTSGKLPGLAPIPVPGFAGPQDSPTLPGINTIPGLSNFNYVVGQLIPQMIPPTNTLLGSSISRLLPKDTTKNLAKNVFRAVHPAAENVEVARMMGRWFQVINSPHVIREACTVTHFGALTNHTYSATFTILKFYREGNPNGPPRFSLGYGFKAGDTGQFLLHSSNSPDAEPFWVIKLGPLNEYKQYDYAIVSNWVRYPVFVIARDPERFTQKHMKNVLQFLEDNNYINVMTKAFNMISPVDYSQCQYTPTFSGAGK